MGGEVVLYKVGSLPESSHGKIVAHTSYDAMYDGESYGDGYDDAAERRSLQVHEEAENLAPAMEGGTTKSDPQVTEAVKAIAAAEDAEAAAKVAKASFFTIDIALQHWISSLELSIEIAGNGIAITNVKNAELYGGGSTLVHKQTIGEPLVTIRLLLNKRSIKEATVSHNSVRIHGHGVIGQVKSVKCGIPPPNLPPVPPAPPPTGPPDIPPDAWLLPMPPPLPPLPEQPQGSFQASDGTGLLLVMSAAAAATGFAIYRRRRAATESLVDDDILSDDEDESESNHAALANEQLVKSKRGDAKYKSLSTKDQQSGNARESGKGRGPPRKPRANAELDSTTIDRIRYLVDDGSDGEDGRAEDRAKKPGTKKRSHMAP